MNESRKKAGMENPFPNWLEYPLQSSPLKKTRTKIDNPPIEVEQEIVINQNRDHTFSSSEIESPPRKWNIIVPK